MSGNEFIMAQLCEVSEALAVACCPEPFMVGKEDGEDEDEDEEEEKQQGKSKASNAVKTTKVQKSKITRKETDKLGPNYKPNEFRIKYKEFMSEMKAQGVARTEANKQWASHPTRLALISGMSEAEKRRRRFI